jgi:hypothetical protein
MASISLFLSSMSMRNWAANILAWWYPACCIVGPLISFSSLCANLKCALKFAQVLSVSGFVLH